MNLNLRNLSQASTQKIGEKAKETALLFIEHHTKKETQSFSFFND
jgi:hypothetical protein